jgi:radical SAM protein with 4Fe4S-binding SPASM domain
MSADMFETVMQQLSAWPGPHFKVVKLSLYGEPMLNPLFPEMVRCVKEARIAERVETTTNASLLTEEVALKLVESQLDYMRVSIYATDQDRHQQITGTQLPIERIRNNLLMLKSLKQRLNSERPFVSCKMIDNYNAENQKFFDEFTNIADEAYIDEPHEWIQVDEADFLGQYYKEQAQAVRTNIKERHSNRTVCPMAFTTMAIRSNGDVSPCCVDFIGGTTIGNLAVESAEQIWLGSRWLEFQKMQLEGRRDENESCARCELQKSDHYTRDDIDDYPFHQLLEERKSWQHIQ